MERFKLKEDKNINDIVQLFKIQEENILKQYEESMDERKYAGAGTMLIGLSVLDCMKANLLTLLDKIEDPDDQEFINHR